MKDEGSYELVDYRLEQAQTALDDPKFLLDGNRSPQSILNRSYYAMFYTVLALLQSIGRVPSKHSGAISIFDTEFVRKGTLPKELSRDLHKAFRSFRHSCGCPPYVVVGVGKVGGCFDGPWKCPFSQPPNRAIAR